MLENVKVLLGIADNDSDNLLNLLITIAKDEAASFCHLAAYSEELDTIVMRMVCQLYNRQDSEGLTGVSFGGVNETNLNNYSDDVIKALKAHRKLVTR